MFDDVQAHREATDSLFADAPRAVTSAMIEEAAARARLERSQAFSAALSAVSRSVRGALLGKRAAARQTQMLGATRTC